MSSSNYLSHLKRRHGDTAVDDYDKYRKSKKTKINESDFSNLASKKIQVKNRQTQLDGNVTNFVIDSMIHQSIYS